MDLKEKSYVQFVVNIGLVGGIGNDKYMSWLNQCVYDCFINDDQSSL